jgi:ubiquinone/menaquinone biosynthesis C-methylase UbiE
MSCRYGNQKLYEKKMADFLDIGPGSKVADIGCGRGRDTWSQNAWHSSREKRTAKKGQVSSESCD